MWDWLEILLEAGKLRSSFSRSARGGRVCSGEQLANCVLVRFASAGAEHAADLISVLIIKKGCRKRAIPLRPDGLCKSSLVAVLFAVVRENRLIARDKPPHQHQITFVVEIDAHHLQTLWLILFRQFVQHGIFIPAGLAPSGPEGHQQGFAYVLLH